MNEISYLALLILLAVSGALASVAAAAQAALPAKSRARLHRLLQEGAPRIQTVERTAEQLGTMLSSSVAVYTIGMALAVGSALLIAFSLGQINLWLGIGVALLLLLVLLLFQIFARALAVSRSERAALVLINLLRILRVVLWPLVTPAVAIERFALRAFGASHAAELNVADEELRLLMEEAEEKGALEEEERDMIHGIFNLAERPVREIMVPRLDVVALERHAQVRDALDKITSTGHSRLPLYDGNIDDVVGVIVAKDILRHLRNGSLDSPVEPLLRPIHFVPETKKIDELLHEFQQRKVSLAIVVDEYGGTAGLITIEDVVEEIVGDIRDEYDIEEELFERISDAEAIFDARMNLRDVGEVLDIDLEGELEEHAYDTLGGLVYERLGRVPVEGDEVRVNGYMISVLTTQGNRIRKVRVLVGSHAAREAED